jgi:hypothetical protein
MNLRVMTMKSAKILVGCLALTMLLLAVSGSSAAGIRTLAPGDSHTVKLKVDSGELVTYWWTSNWDLHFVLKAPDGSTIVDVTSTAYDDFFTADQAGTYTLKWTNDGTSTATLTFSSPLQDLSHGFDMIFWAVVIGGIVIVAVIVLVVVLSLTKKSRTPQPGMTPQMSPQYVAQVAATGKCPMCGMPVEPQGMFCAKCGAKLK